MLLTEMLYVHGVYSVLLWTCLFFFDFSPSAGKINVSVSNLSTASSE